MLKMELRVGESVKIGEAVVTLEAKSGQLARLSIEARPDVQITKIRTTTPADLARNGIGMMPAPA